MENQSPDRSHIIYGVVPNDYAVKIKELRGRLGLTQTQLAERLRVSFVTVNRWENGKSKPSSLAWEQIVDFLGEGTETHASKAVVTTIPALDFTGRPWRFRKLCPGISGNVVRCEVRLNGLGVKRPV